MKWLGAIAARLQKMETIVLFLFFLLFSWLGLCTWPHQGLLAGLLLSSVFQFEREIYFLEFNNSRRCYLSSRHPGEIVRDGWRIHLSDVGHRGLGNLCLEFGHL